ncbi:DUF3326 domain-containing protein [Calothrix sp. NIES-3974]|uniref:DUF3326 domain-containing protein n=1 Tax=Calothrix sp. NIES-3974 TaxID=2005462 RepID=UPI000B5FEA21|nr:DUF3326 domain-containing protein [Calothrix sp. NIES-3974]BAZ03965.1 hypothetical protein NIES3974_05950 [Calothrix sp. NIES-3974]
MRPYTAILIIPTGIGAAIGGYAGDGLPVAKAMSQVVDRLITHPNVMNGAMMYWPIPNTLYVEGYGLDRFASGNWGLRPVHQNKIGIILDQEIEPELRIRQLQAADAARATLGLQISDYIITDAPLGVELQISNSGSSWGTIRNPDALLQAADQLIQKANVNAIAVVARFPDEIDPIADLNYRKGQGVDPIAGCEAIISHLIVREFQIPCAHAPAFSPPPLDTNLSPRSAAEEIGYTFLPSVLVGLHRAPQFLSHPSDPFPQPWDIWSNQVDALVIPATASGNSCVMHLSQQNTLIIAVEENYTQIQVLPHTIGIKSLQVQSYLEAIGILAAHKSGIDPQGFITTKSSQHIERLT